MCVGTSCAILESVKFLRQLHHFLDFSVEVSLSPLRIDKDGLDVLGVLVEFDLLYLLQLDHALKLMKVTRVLIKVTVYQLLLILFFLLGDDLARVALRLEILLLFVELLSCFGRVRYPLH